MIVASVVLVAHVAGAGPNSNEVTFGGGTRALRSSSANALTAESLDGTTLGYARLLGESPVPSLALWVEAALDWGSARGALFRQMTTEVGSFAMTAGLRSRYSLHRLVAVSARLDLGADHASLVLAESGRTASDAGWGVLATAALATDILVVNRHHLALGLRAELGYTRTSSIGLAPSFEPTGDGTLKLPMTDASLGHLDLSGPCFHVSLLGQF